MNAITILISKVQFCLDASERSMGLHAIIQHMHTQMCSCMYEN